MKSKGTAILLAFFLGGFGAHRFYLGATTAGIMSVLFFWTFIPAIVAFFGFLQLCFMSEADFNAKYNKDAVKFLQTSAPKSAVDELTALAKLHEGKFLTTDEFNVKKAELLKRIG